MFIRQLIIIFLFCLFSTQGYTASIKESELPSALSISNTDRFRIVKGTTSQNVTWATIQATIKAYTDTLYAAPTVANSLSGPYIDWNATTGGSIILHKPTIPVVSNAPYDVTTWDNNLDAPSKNAIRDKIEALSGGHSPVTLNSNSDGLLGLSTQEISLDNQIANKIFSGPTTGSATTPTFRSLVSADIPTLNQTTTGTAAGLTGAYIDWDATSGGSSILHKPDFAGSLPASLTSIASLTETNGGMLYGAGDNSYSWLAAGSANYLLQGNGAAAPSFTNSPILAGGKFTSLADTNDHIVAASSDGTLKNAVAATQLVNGYMTTAQVTKLDGIATGANVGVVPNANIVSATKTKITYDTKGLVTSGSNATQDDIGDGTTYKQYSLAEKTKLAGIAENANNYVHPTGDGNKHVPANSTTNSGKVLTAGAVAGTYTWETPATPTIITGLTFNVRDYGALGDGVTNDTVSIQATINAAASYINSGGRGAIVEFNNGSYVFSSLTISSKNTVLRGKGRGATWLLKNTTTGDGIVFHGTALMSGGGISDMALSQQSADAVSGNLLSIINTGFTYIKDVAIAAWASSIMHKPYNGIYAIDCWGLTIDKVTCSDVANDGLYIASSLDTFITNLVVNASGRYGCYFSRCAGVYAVNIANWGNVVNAFRTDSLAAVGLVDGNNYHFYTNCIFDTSGSHNCWIESLNVGSFNNCWASTQLAHTASGSGFAIISCNRVSLNNCTAITNNTNGAYFYNSTRTKITGGYYDDNGSYIASYPYDTRSGILADSGDYIINGASCTNNLNATQIYGIYLKIGFDNFTVVNNDTRINVLNGIYSSYGQSATKIITNNRQ